MGLFTLGKGGASSAVLVPSGPVLSCAGGGPSSLCWLGQAFLLQCPVRSRASPPRASEGQGWHGMAPIPLLMVPWVGLGHNTDPSCSRTIDPVVVPSSSQA